jgi:hypothetical protein
VVFIHGFKAEGYPYLIQALGGGLAKSLGTVVNLNSYNAIIPSIPTSSGFDSRLVVPAAGVRAAYVGSDNGDTNIAKFPNMAFYGYDLEKVSSILFSGLNTRASPPFLNLHLAVASTSSIICQAWGISDVVLVFDTVSKQVQAFI